MLIQFTPSDKLAATVAEPGWVKAIMTECEGKQSKSGNSINFWAVFKIIEGKYVDKEVKCTFNTAVNSSSVLGGMYMMPHLTMMQIEACVNNRVKDGKLDMQSVPLGFNSDDLLNKPLDIEIGTAPDENGGMFNFPKNFLPAGQSASTSKVPF